jgi:hypothetical protein
VWKHSVESNLVKSYKITRPVVKIIGFFEHSSFQRVVWIV